MLKITFVSVLTGMGIQHHNKISNMTDFVPKQVNKKRGNIHSSIK